MSDDLVDRLLSSYSMLGDPLHKQAAERIQDYDRLVELTSQTNFELLERLETQFARAEALALEIKGYRHGLIEIIQRERFPRESGSHVYDDISPLGAFANEVLNRRWPKS
jgi:hypothetical protein